MIGKKHGHHQQGNVQSLRVEGLRFMYRVDQKWHHMLYALSSSNTNQF